MNIKTHHFNRLPHLASLLVGTPLMIEPAKLEVLLQVLGAQDLRRQASTDQKTTVLDATGAGNASTSPGPAEPGIGDGGIAVIQAVGSLTKRSLGLDALSGLASYDQLQAQLSAALLDPSVEGIVLDVDSPGGEASGVFDLADRIRAGRSIKPIYAVANDRALSAAYALASSASKVFVSRTAAVGSIGVIAMHVDQSVRDAASGLRYTPVYAGARKADLSPHAPISDTARSQLQAEVDRLYGLFVNTVATNRGLGAQAVRASEAGVFFGEGAVKAGLADAVGTLQEAMQAMRAELQGAANPTRRAGAVLLSAHGPPPTPSTPQIPAPHPSPAFGSLQSHQGLVVSGSDSVSVPYPTPPLLKDLPTMSTPEQQASAAASATPPATTSMAPPPSPVNPAPTSPAPVNTALQIADLCLLAGCPERTAEFLARGVGEDTVRRELLAARAQGGMALNSQGGHGSGEITSHIAPRAMQLGGVPTPAALPLDQNPLVLAAQGRAAVAR